MTRARRRVIVVVGLGVLLAAMYAAQTRIRTRQEDSPSGAPPLPTVESAAQLVLVGFRAVVVDVFWMQASALQEEGRIDEAVAKYDRITKLQPDLADVWHYLIWNTMYNLPYEVEAVEDKWNLIKLGVEYIDTAEKRVPENPYFAKEVGFMLWHRFDDKTFPEATYLRRRFREWKKETNFEAAVRWLERAIRWLERDIDKGKATDPGEGAKDIWRRQITYALDRWATQSFVDGELETARKVAERAIEKWKWAAQFNKSTDPGLDRNIQGLDHATKRLEAIVKFIASKKAAEQKKLDKALELAGESVDRWQALVDVWPSGPDLPALQKAAAWLERLRVNKKAENEKK